MAEGIAAPATEKPAPVSTLITKAGEANTERKPGMPKYIVIVRYEQEKEITVYASDELAAEEKACQIVEDWNGVISSYAVETEEEG